jgi:tetratricopeptide (TPR) repeat protein
MDCWKVLDLEPTDDLRLIKKAYAKKLKIYHPEDDAAGYQKLREAYELAQRLVRQGEISYWKYESINSEMQEDSIQEELLQENEKKESIMPECEDETSAQQEFEPESSDEDFDYDALEWYNDVSENADHDGVETFMATLSQLYENESQRTQLEQWRELFNDVILWNLEKQQYLYGKVITFLVSHHYLPNEVWQFLDQQFQWSENTMTLTETYGEEKVSYVMARVKGDVPFITPYWLAGKSNLDSYYKEIEIIYSKLIRNAFPEAISMIKSARKTWGDDPNVLILEAEHSLWTNRERVAKKLYAQLRTQLPNNIELYLIMTRTLLKFRLYKDALTAINQVLEKEPQHIAVLLLASECYGNKRRFKEAQKLYMDAVALEPTNLQVISFGNRLSKAIYKNFNRCVFVFSNKKLLEELYVHTGIPYNQEKYTQSALLQMGMINCLQIMCKYFAYSTVFIAIIVIAVAFNMVGAMVAGGMAKFGYEKYVKPTSAFE